MHSGGLRGEQSGDGRAKFQHFKTLENKLIFFFTYTESPRARRRVMDRIGLIPLRCPMLTARVCA